MVQLFLRLGAWAVFTVGIAVGLTFPTGDHALGLSQRGVLLVGSALGLVLLLVHTFLIHFTRGRQSPDCMDEQDEE
jgi:hypothetical protein